MNEISKPLELTYIPAQIYFPQYERLLADSHKVAKIIRNTELTEENIKEVKRMLADARKATDKLNSKRIAVKNHVLKEYEVFKAQVDEIIGVVDEADKELRSKVREMEEVERFKKADALREEWNDRIGHYDFDGFITFERFLEPRHLNKNTSFNKTVEEMGQWLEERQRDWKIVSVDHDLLGIYLKSLSLSQALEEAERLKAEKEELEKKLINDNKIEKKEITIFIVEDKAQAKLAEILLKENGIHYGKEIK